MSKDQSADTGRKKPRLVVGIGASAGGIDACKRLLEAMPHDTGLAFVIVMHLDPTRESHIAEIFQAATEMKVVQITGELRLSPDHVYVIAPDTSLSIHDGMLQTAGPRLPHGARKPVDDLFSSLAEDQKERAVGIILSGTGNNGSSGLRDIEACGGLCLVQQPETAQFDGMPQSALATGLADAIVAPEEMPGLLLEYAEDPAAFAPDKAAARVTQAPAAFDRILDLLGRTYGVNFRGAYKRGTLERRAERRLGLKQLSGWQSYLDLLTHDPVEVAALYRDLLIGVTEFFRDREVWDVLESELLTGLLAAHDEGMPFKIWVAGCATGEEPYSLAMAFLEQIERSGRKIQLQIFATDVAEDALAIARRGRYPSTIRETVSPERISRFLRDQGDKLEISREVRDAVTFARHNLLADPPFSQLNMVSCRNVLIYLEPHAQQRVFELFQFALRPGGLLLLGASETIGQHTDVFEAVSERARVYRSKATTAAARHRHLLRTQKPLSLRGLPGAAVHSPAGPRVSRMVEQIVLSRYTWPCVAVTESFEIQAFFGPTQNYLTQPTGEARMDLLAWARPRPYTRLRAAIERAREHNERAHITNLHMERNGQSERVECTVEPITPLPGEGRLFVVAFRDVPRAPAEAIPDSPASDEPLVRQLEAQIKNAREELQSTVEQLESTNEDHRASHEELLSLNEELQSNNEELEASKEELQSLNEEMVTINRQLEDKNVDLRAINDDLSNLLVSVAVPIIFLDRDLRVRRFTPTATELMRLLPSDIGRSVEHIKERFQDGGLIQDAKRVLDKLVPITTEVQTEDGRVYARSVLPYRTQDDRIDGVCIAFHDVTDRKRAAQEIEDARRYAEAIVRTVRTPLVVLDKDLRVVSANERFYNTFRVTRPEIEGARFYDLGNHQWDIPLLRELLEKVLPEHTEIKDYDVDHELERIGRRVVRLNAHRMRRRNRQDLILLAIEDITEQRAAARITERRADELSQEHQRKDEFLAMLGHELRNPLSAVVHGLDLWGLSPDDPARLARIREMMTRQAQRIGSMLDELLDVARLTAGKIKLAQVPVDLAEAAQAAVEAVTPLIESRKHALLVSPTPAGTVMVQGDLGRLTQAVENLLSNAAKYTEEGGKIELLLESDEDIARVRVRDSGIGMEAALIPHIFELFTQDVRALDRAAGGLGLGLPLVNRLVEMHGGTVEASSPGRGRGSEFVISLPRIEKQRTEAAREPGTGPENARAHRILVVDDERDSATMFAEILAIRGHQARAVHDGPTALEFARTFHPDVVLLDIGLPGMDGYEVARRLRDEHKDAKILLVALTGYQQDADRLRQAGFDRHLIKPPDMHKLSRWLAAWEEDRCRAPDGVAP